MNPKLLSITLVLLFSFCFAEDYGATITYHIGCKKNKEALKIKQGKKTYYFEKTPIYSTNDVHLNIEWGLSSDGLANIVEGDYFLIPSEQAKQAIKNRLQKKKRLTLLIAGDGKVLAIEKIKAMPEEIKIDKKVFKELSD